MPETLYTTDPSNQYQALVLGDASAWDGLSPNLNRKSLAQGWKMLDFEFTQNGGQTLPAPDICAVYLPGIIVFRKDLKAALFPSPCEWLEFLPVNVAGGEWLLLNCLKSTNQYDRGRSICLRGTNNEIFLVQKIAVTDQTLDACQVFTIEDSNRGQLFVLPPVRERAMRLGLKGINFREIGTLEKKEPKGRA
jgi:hypothetical protein